MKTPNKLSEIPGTLFELFTLPEPIHEWVSDEIRGRTTVQTRLTHVSVGAPASTVALRTFRCARGIGSVEELYVFSRIVDIDHALQLGGNVLPLPLIVVASAAVHPPADDAPWLPGRGFWVAEELTVAPTPFSKAARLGSLGFVSRVAARARELEREVACRGHWECEWHPRGEYDQRKIR